jgi:cell division control protein 6
MANIDELLKQSRLAVSKDTKIIKDPGIFDFSYVPKKIFIRDEAKIIIDNIVKFDSLKTPFNLFIYGSRGSGKTVLLKYLEENLSDKIATPIRYVNCRFNNTTTKILGELLDRKTIGLGKHELCRDLVESYDRLLIVLDEADMLSNREKDILYYLSRSQKKYMVILLSNNPNFYGRIDLSAKSTLQLEKMHFRNYNAHEIYEILLNRCKEGLKSYSKLDLKKIAALTARETNGDVRIALKTLQYRVTRKYARIETNFEKAKEDIYVDLLDNQSDQVLIILRAVQGSEEKLVKAVYEHYKGLCRLFKENPYSYMHFYNNLSYLQSIGLILLIATKVHRAMSNSIELLFDYEILNNVFEGRFG